MSVECLLDTNVLVYAAAGRGPEDAKRTRALELIDGTEFGLSVQSLQEFYVTVTRKIEIPLDAEEALKWIEQWEVFPTAVVDKSLLKNAVVLSERYRISYWDGAIVAAAETLGAKTLYSEDLNHGQQYESVTVTNPFAGH